MDQIYNRLRLLEILHEASNLKTGSLPDQIDALYFSYKKGNDIESDLIDLEDTFIEMLKDEYPTELK